MSGVSPDITLGTIGAAAGIPTLNVADIPANIRNGNRAAQQAYAEGLAFENVLVNELTQQLANTMYGGQGLDGGSSTDGAGDGSDGAGGASGLLSGAGAYSSLIPQALSSSIMSGGGTGLAEEFAQELDPALLTQPGTAQPGTAQPGAAQPGTTEPGTAQSDGGQAVA